MKRVVLVLALVAVIAIGSAFADHPGGLGIGVVGGGGMGGFGGGLGLNIPGVPIFWVIDIDGFGSHGILLGVRGDYYLIDQDLVDKWLGWYLGVGGFVRLGLTNDYAGIGAGVRIPIGLSFQPIPLLEIFLEIAPQVGFWAGNEFSLGTNFFGGALGIKLWL